MIYSFDVFDTCITRSCAFPRDLFFILGLRLAPKHLTEKEALKFAKKFQSRRIRAEKIAHRQARPRESANIYDIYDNFTPPKGIHLNKHELIRAELNLELENTYPIQAMASHIESLRIQGNKIIFISDMYIPSEHLTPILKEHGIMKDGDNLYVSCDAGVSKHSGKLFHYVLKKEEASYEELIHTGDNHWGDIQMARNAGIKAAHFRESILNERERLIAKNGLFRTPASSFLSALSRRARLYSMQSIKSEYGALSPAINGIIAPFIVSYVLWVIDRARSNSIQRLYFVARDGEILFRVAQILQQDKNDIDLRYLYGSRRAWLSPAMQGNFESWKRHLIHVDKKNSRHDILSRVDFDESTQNEIRNILGISHDEWTMPISRYEAEGFLALIFQHEKTRGIALNIIETRRNTTLAYFSQEGLFDDISWAVVDTGWALSTQAALKAILESSNRPHRQPFGYYIGMAKDHSSPDQAGGAQAFISPPGSFFARRRTVIDHCFTPSTHATTCRYKLENNIAYPVFGEDPRSEEERSYTNNLHQATISLAQLVALNPTVSQEIIASRVQIVMNAKKFLRNPTFLEATLMSNFGATSDLRHDKHLKPLCCPLHAPDIFRIFFTELFSKDKSKAPAYVWLEGSLAISPRVIRVPMLLLLQLDSLKNRLLHRD